MTIGLLLLIWVVVSPLLGVIVALILRRLDRLPAPFVVETELDGARIRYEAPTRAELVELMGTLPIEQEAK